MLAGARIGVCMSVTIQTAVLVETLRGLGASVRLCSPNPLVTQVRQTLSKNVYIRTHQTVLIATYKYSDYPYAHITIYMVIFGGRGFEEDHVEQFSFKVIYSIK